MTLQSFYIKSNYSKYENPYSEFFIPSLSNSNAYWRFGGFFNSKNLATCAEGIQEFLKNDGKIKYANDNGFTVNLSADSLDHADELKALGIGPVVVIVPADQAYNHTITTKAGNKVNICPATYQDNVTCKTCQLCQHAGRSNMVGFPAHGTGKGNIT